MQVIQEYTCNRTHNTIGLYIGQINCKLGALSVRETLAFVFSFPDKTLTDKQRIAEVNKRVHL
jgi:hypothetical protein